MSRAVSSSQSPNLRATMSDSRWVKGELSAFSLHSIFTVSTYRKSGFASMNFERFIRPLAFDRSISIYFLRVSLFFSFAKIFFTLLPQITAWHCRWSVGRSLALSPVSDLNKNLKIYFFSLFFFSLTRFCLIIFISNWEFVLQLYNRIRVGRIQVQTIKFSHQLLLLFSYCSNNGVLSVFNSFNLLRNTTAEPAFLCVLDECSDTFFLDRG